MINANTRGNFLFVKNLTAGFSAHIIIKAISNENKRSRTIHRNLRSIKKTTVKIIVL